MTQDLQDARLDKLEIVFAEHEYTVETLNTIVTRQGEEIRQLKEQLDLFTQQMKELKMQLPAATTQVDEKPPHY